MVQPRLSRDRLQRLMKAAGEELTGDWVLVGGALAALWFSPDRETEDVDLIAVPEEPDGPPPGPGVADRRHALMDFALAQGLPLEAVNSAADFFLQRLTGWKAELELLHAGRGARIFRPTPTLFLLLKAGRMSEADLADCLGLLDLAARTGLTVDRGRVLAHLAAMPDPESGRAAMRRERLRAVLAGE